MRDFLKRYWCCLKRNAVWKGITAFEVLVLIVLLANCFRSCCDYTFSAGELNISGEHVWESVDENGTPVYAAFCEGEVDGEVILSTGYLKFLPGAYNISVNYSSQVYYIEESSSETGLSYLNLESENNSAFFDFDSLLLRDGLSFEEQTVQIKSLWAISDLELTVSYYGYGELTISSIEVREIVAYRFVCFLGALLFFILTDLFCFLVFVDRKFRYGKELGILAVICAAAVLPFMVDFTYWGHDIGFHVNRIILLAYEISHGNYFPTILTAALNGYGYPAPLFYGEIFLYIPAILYCCGFGLTTVYNLYICLMSVSTCLIMYACALKIFRKTNAALLAAAVYTLSAVRLTNVMVRSAVGEFSAQTFLPLVFLGFYNIYTAPKGERIPFRGYWPVIVGLTAIFSCHTLSFEMSAMMILLVCLVLIRRTLEPQRFLALAKAAVLTLLVNLAFLVVMLDSLGMDMVVSHQMGGSIQSTGVYLIQIFNSVVNGYQADQQAGTAFEEMSLSAGFPIILGLVLFLVYLACRKTKERVNKENRDFASLCWGFSLFTIFLSTVYMFYDSLDFLPDSIYNLLVVYQFSWRWLIFAALFGTFCTAAVVNEIETENFLQGIPVTGLLCLALIINMGQIYSDQLSTSSLSQFNNNLYGYTTWVGGDNMLWQTDIYQVYYRDLIYDDTQLSAGEYLKEDGSWVLYDVENASDQVVTVDIPLFHYDNYAAYDAKTGEEIEISNGSNNRIQLNIPAGYSGTIEIKYEIPLLWKLAATVSAVTDIILIAYVCLQKRNAQMKKGEVQ